MKPQPCQPNEAAAQPKPTFKRLQQIVARVGGTLENEKPANNCRVFYAVAPTGQQWRDCVGPIRIEWARGDSAECRDFNARELESVEARLGRGLVPWKPQPPPILDCRDLKNWRFTKDDVPDSEIVACCYWEYARESTSFHKAIAWFNQEGPDIFDEKLSRFSKLGHLGLWDIGSPAEMFFGVMCPARSFPDAWQSLPRRERRELVKAVEEKPSAIMASPRVYEAEHTARVLLKRAEENRDIYNKQFDAQFRHRGSKIVGFHRPRPNPDTRLSELWTQGEVLAGVESIVLGIGWRWYRNTEIAAAFAEWVDTKRPPTIPEPTENAPGHDRADWRTKLRDLGVLRLTKKWTPGQFKYRCVEAEKAFDGWAYSQFSAARRRAEKHFRQLLRCLPPSELPIHARNKCK